MEIIYSNYFLRAYKKCPQEIKKIAKEKEIIFRADPFDHRLKTHKLHGHLKNCWAFSINSSYRVVFEFNTEQKTILFNSIGKHAVYKI